MQTSEHRAAVRHPASVALVRSPDSLLAADSLAALAARAAGTPTSLIQLADSDDLLLIGASGLPVAWEHLVRSPIGSTLAGVVFDTGLPFVVEDTATDRRVPPEAPVRQIGARAYAGFPIRDPDGEVVGVCCVLDYRPRRWSAEELSGVDHAAQACTSFVAEQYARRDADRDRRFLDAVIENLRDGVMACDDTGKVVLVNAAMRALLAAPPDRFDASRPAGVMEILEPDGRVLDPRNAPLARAFRGERIRDAELMIAGEGGTSRLLLADAAPIVDAAGGRLGAVVATRDVTARRRAERFRACELAVSAALAEAVSAEQAGPHVLQAVATTLGWAHAELWLVDDAQQVLRPAAEWSPPGRAPSMPVPPHLGFGFGLAGRTWQAGKPLWIRDIGQPQSLVSSDSAQASQLRTALAMPVRSGRRILGVLCLFAGVVEDPQDSLIALLSGITAHVGQFLERRRAEDLQLELARTKDEYVALVGHELRTPITSIGAYTEMLLESEPEVLVREGPAMLTVIERNTARLRRVVDELLDIAALDTGHATIHRQPCDLADIIRGAVAEIEPALELSNLVLHLDVPDRLVLDGDPGRLRQVVDNLLSNAVKYSPDGGRIAVAACRPDPGTVQVTVTDTGIGIPVEERERMFSRFYRSSNAHTRGIPGTGLGLATSRAIVERHHGTINLLPNDGHGTAIRVRLPVGVDG